MQVVPYDKEHPETKILEIHKEDALKNIYHDNYHDDFQGFILINENSSIKELRFNQAKKFGWFVVKDLLIVRYGRS